MSLNDLFCVEWDVKFYCNSTNQVVSSAIESTDINQQAEVCFLWAAVWNSATTSPVQQQSVTEQFQIETENAYLWAMTNIIWCCCGVSFTLVPQLSRLTYLITYLLWSDQNFSCLF